MNFSINSEVVLQKEVLLEYYKQTFENLQSMVEELNEEQMHYEISEEKWSVSEVLEHIILTEEALFTMTQQSMAEPANPERKGEIRVTDDQLVAGMENRSQKVKTSPELEPSGIYDDPAEALKKLEEQRDEILEFIKETSVEDMRNHVFDTPMGPVDGYQSLLFIAAHTARHTAQIAEVKANPDFPSGE